MVPFDLFSYDMKNFVGLKKVLWIGELGLFSLFPYIYS